MKRRVVVLVILVVLVMLVIPLSGCMNQFIGDNGSSSEKHPQSFVEYKEYFDTNLGQGNYSVQASSAANPAGEFSFFAINFVDATGAENFVHFNGYQLPNEVSWKPFLARLSIDGALEIVGGQMGAPQLWADDEYDGMTFHDRLPQTGKFLFSYPDVAYFTDGTIVGYEHSRFPNIANPKRILDPQNGLLLSKVTPRYLADEWGIRVYLQVWEIDEEGLAKEGGIDLLKEEISALIVDAVERLDYPEMAVQLYIGEPNPTDDIIGYYDEGTGEVLWDDYYDYIDEHDLIIGREL